MAFSDMIRKGKGEKLHYFLVQCTLNKILPSFFLQNVALEIPLNRETGFFCVKNADNSSD